MGRKRISISHLAPRMANYYLLSSLVSLWEQQGHRVDIARAYSEDADVCILHHDLTQLNADALPAPPPGAPLLNGRVLDISKRTISMLQVRPGDDWPGRVIIKTNLNHYGGPEYRSRLQSVLTKVRKRLAQVSWRGAQTLPHEFYPVLNTMNEVPDWVWESPDFVIEKFLPERTKDKLYSVRGYVFLGERGYAYRVFSRQPLVKLARMARIEYLDVVPDALLEIRRSMSFDFGKFDYVEHEGRVFLLDANKTPVYRGDVTSPRMNLLASGIDSYL